MVTPHRSTFLTFLKRCWIPYQVILPVLAGVAMLGFSLLPWLSDPLGEHFSAWQLPVDIGWQFHSALLNYGVLCFLCACYAFFVAFANWKPLKAEKYIHALTFHKIPSCVLAGLLCLIPPALFLLQYLYIDMDSMVQLVHHERQFLLIKAHLDYGLAAQFIPLLPLEINSLSLHDRFSVLLDQISIGYWLTFISVLLLFVGQAFVPATTLVQAAMPLRRRAALLLGCFGLLLFVLLGRGPAAFASNFQAEHLLTTGEYAKALQWLDTARFLNPSLDQLAAYHIERGMAWHYLHLDQPNADSQSYIADFYLQQKDYLSALQEQKDTWQTYAHTPWMQDDLNVTLALLAEMNKPLTGAPASRQGESASLPWLYELVHIDPANVYGHFIIGRILYDMHDYSNSVTHMNAVITLSNNRDFLSSAYTYLGLDSEGQKNYAIAREFLFKAQDLDPNFYNNIARQELSGLR